MSDAIWVERPILSDLNQLHENTAVAQLGIVMREVGDDYLTASMPVDARTKQPFGLLHGGASALLLETLASAAANHCVEGDKMCVGLELNCNHIGAVRSGEVVGTARALHVGRSSMVWALEVHDDRHRLVCVGRLTCAVVDKPASAQ